MILNFIQSNWLRQYPFRDGQGVTDLNNEIVPIDLIVGLRITYQGSGSDVFINKIYTNRGAVSIGLAYSGGDLGYANGTITQDNQSIPVLTYSGGVIGNIIIGNSLSTQPAQSFLFNNTNGLVEPSTLMVLPAPAVTNIIIKGVVYTGDVEFTSSTLDITDYTNLNFVVINPTLIPSNGDQSSSFLTCPNNTIIGINTVTPDINGNISIYAIEPLTISQTSTNQLQITSTGLVLSNTNQAGNLCNIVNISPVNTADTYGALGTIPEWSSWPQYTI